MSPSASIQDFPSTPSICNFPAMAVRKERLGDSNLVKAREEGIEIEIDLSDDKEEDDNHSM